MRRKGRLGSLIVTCYTWTSRIFPVGEWQFFTPKQVITQDGEEDLNFYDIFVAFVKGLSARSGGSSPGRSQEDTRL